MTPEEKQERQAYLNSLDRSMPIEDPSDQRLFDSIMTRPIKHVSSNHIDFLKVLHTTGKGHLPALASATQ